MVPNMQPHQTLTTLLRKISTVQMKGPRFSSFWKRARLGVTFFDQGFFAPQQIIRTDHGLIAEPTVCDLKVSKRLLPRKRYPCQCSPLPRVCAFAFEMTPRIGLVSSVRDPKRKRKRKIIRRPCVIATRCKELSRESGQQRRYGARTVFKHTKHYVLQCV